MRAKLSSTAFEKYTSSASLNQAFACDVAVRSASGSSFAERNRSVAACPVAAEGEGLLHDARNLMGALGLYCDLLSMPGVLKPEHGHYPEELRLLGSRSGALIEHLMQQLLAREESGCRCQGMPHVPLDTKASASTKVELAHARPAGTQADAFATISLRVVVEHNAGLLTRVAGGRPVEITYGAAAMVPVRVAEDAVERILVNLVRNAAAASSGTPGAIRIGVGLLVNRVGDPKPWPFRRVRLTVEDSGCGMEREQLDRLLSGTRAPSRGSHGIGFRVVRELIAGSGGDLRVMSAPGVGTCVQIEWPMAAPADDAIDPGDEKAEGLQLGRRGQLPERYDARMLMPFPGGAGALESKARLRRSGDFGANAERRTTC